VTPTRKRRLIAVLLILAGVGVASTIAFYSLQQNMLYFQSPSELAQQPIPPGRQFRLGGLPDLFREGQGVIARGSLDSSGMFAASEVLAKHDENYMPPEVAEALEESGHLMKDGK
jgi:cytochrome c-type biogenesis protein CcmE